MTASNQKSLLQAAEALQSLSTDVSWFASLHFEDEAAANLSVSITHLERVTSNLKVLCELLRRPVNTSED